MTQDILWLKFAEDTSIPEYFGQADQKKFELIFNANNATSLWCKALETLDIPHNNQNKMIRWINNYPYINWTASLEIISGGSIYPKRLNKSDFKLSNKRSLSVIWTLIKRHWNVSKYVTTILQKPLPNQNDQKIIESLSLGICLLLLQQRLNIVDEGALATALSNPEKLPTSKKNLIQQIIAVQKRRTDLSDAWSNIFSKTYHNQQRDLPTHFWNNYVSENSAHNTNHKSLREWSGVGVSGTSITAPVFIIENLKEISDIKINKTAPIFIFKYAKADTIRLFSKASGIIYCNGGALAHACTIAREQNMPCITGVGDNFWSEMVHMTQNDPKIVLKINPQEGSILIKE